MEPVVKTDHVTFHNHPGPETASQSVQNYAGAAFLVGMAFMVIGMGVGFMKDRGVFSKKDEDAS